MLDDNSFQIVFSFLLPTLAVSSFSHDGTNMLPVALFADCSLSFASSFPPPFVLFAGTH
jgi:hypothetical protein